MTSSAEPEKKDATSAKASVLARLTSSAGDAVGLMTRGERRNALALVATAISIGVLQILVVAALYGLLRWGFDPDAAIPAWFSNAITLVFGPVERKQLLGALLVGGIAAVVLKVGMSYRQTFAMTRFVSDAERRLSSDLLFRAMMSPYQWFVRQNTEKLRQHMLGFVSIWSRDVLGGFVRLANDVFAALLIVVMMVWYDPTVGLSVIAAGGAMALVLFLTTRPRLRRLALDKQHAVLKINTISKQCIEGIKDIKISSGERDFATEFDLAMREYADVNTRAQALIQLPRHALEMAAYLAIVAVCAYVVFGGAQTKDTSGPLLLYALAGMRLLPALSAIVSTLSSMTSGLPIVANIRRLIDETVDPPQDDRKAVWPEKAWHTIAFDNVSLRYKAGKRSALADVTLAIERGRRYGLIGQSGAGKSSFLDLLVGLLNPSDGTIRVDGVELTEAHHLAWRRRFGSVTQHPFLIDASLRENIVFERGAVADPARLARAITLARLDGVVSRLSGGVEGRLGDRGTLLSGGERQRVAIARAIYRGADILILDEPTSALDAIIEDEIAESLRGLYGEVTTIVVSHRVPLIKDCDEIWLLDEGSLRMCASHEELQRTSELYRRMLDHEAPRNAPEAA